ncbi:IS66 family insertion sequence element accessory protein TnpA [Desulfogranum marinum]|uniref:IS66 family insertion sequence element accessory protein TnpA n=1 Tax=Desulfogranum marinum TaxID=453220 RepID=UPI0029C6A72F|nr:hypothetical protein [Desulfogranum marinum]
MTNRAHKSRFWIAHVEAQAKSGLNRAEYCRQHKLSYHALTYWQKKQRRPDISHTPQLIAVPDKKIQIALSPQGGDMTPRTQKVILSFAG